MGVIRAPKLKNFTTMTNYHLKDKRLSLKAKGIMSLILSLPDNWDYSFNGLVALCVEKDLAVRSALKELKEYGYLEIVETRTNGQFDYDYNIYEQPLPYSGFPHTDEPHTDNPNTDEPYSGNHTQLNTKELNTKQSTTQEKYIEDAPPVITIILNDKSEYPITQNKVDEWAELFQGVDIIKELRKAKAWCIDNPTQRKTKKGILRFCSNWLSRAQDRGGGNAGYNRNAPKDATQSAGGNGEPFEVKFE